MDKVIYNQHFEKVMKMMIYFAARVDIVCQLQGYSLQIQYLGFEFEFFFVDPFLLKG